LAGERVVNELAERGGVGEEVGGRNKGLGPPCRNYDLLACVDFSLHPVPGNLHQGFIFLHPLLLLYDKNKKHKGNYYTWSTQYQWPYHPLLGS
jgi:hypothetical protein